MLFELLESKSIISFLDMERVILLFNFVWESASYLGARSIKDIAKSMVFNTQPDGLCFFGANS